MECCALRQGHLTLLQKYSSVHWCLRSIPFIIIINPPPPPTHTFHLRFPLSQFKSELYRIKWLNLIYWSYMEALWRGLVSQPSEGVHPPQVKAPRLKCTDGSPQHKWSSLYWSAAFISTINCFFCKLSADFASSLSFRINPSDTQRQILAFLQWKLACINHKTDKVDAFMRI